MNDIEEIEPSRRGSRAPALSIVVPVFEEASILPTLISRLRAVLDGLDCDAEVILVDDGSGDGTPAAIAKANRADARIAGLSLSRNFGHQIAISAGLAHARGRQAVVVMDGDLQDPPEAIPALLDRFRDGFDVVYAVRASRPEGWWKRRAYATFYRLLERRGTIRIPLDAGDFSIMSRRVVDHLRTMPEQRRFVRGLRAWVGFRQTALPVDRDPRHSGRPKFTVGKLIGLALDGLIGFGESPLRWAGAAGVVSWMSLPPMLVAIGVSGGFQAPAWLFGLAIAFFLAGAQLLSAAILGEYVCRILQEVRGRPLYVVQRRIGVRGGRRPSRRRPEIATPNHS
jgi:dolichol-phosphate mannosyltransferase